ncbi:MAG: hypothetical protein QF819_04720 [Gemmatimonadota bacterium]|jgi:hypothetical protein|nr:hypothetical protein [Gemmatimonadota bacterium]MDP6802462.1 hypothetical protein [Gemmatimonadota bacterium]MDP7030982.1 hypothetical protein [Gemmatimonadota bacterium]
MMKPLRILIPSLLVAFALVGCESFQDPYKEASLEEMMKGQVQSSTHTYRIPVPKIAAARKNTALVRDGNIFLVMMGPDLKKNLREHVKRGTMLGVRKRKQPRTHLVLDRIYNGKEVVELFSEETKVQLRLPELLGHAEVPFDEFLSDVHLCETEASNTRKLRRFIGSPTTLTEFHVRRDKVLPEVIRSKGREGKAAYVLYSDGADVLVGNEDSSVLLFLDFLIAEDRTFKGGVVFEEMFNIGAREETGIAGRVTIKWIDLGGTLFFRAP